ncbi:MAG TPA: hypothetical protein PLN06_05095 [Bacteroidales bacterium]|nr:hypothetical protein [Bacteroidales bacterium]HOU95985.1 hypothetical protein [Bacteroidales bacterium]HQG36540.1 hypothetical protein [Bacteroidales bacterium]HQJ20652.1 hypothetical protein [Bacteroidales bacterium]HRC89035.1 hypothetical protein [Bacteroidales bacterium]
MLKSKTNLLLFMILLSGCVHEKPTSKQPADTFTTYHADSLYSESSITRKEIFYGLVTPTEVSAIFNRLGIPYHKEIINPVSNHELYTSHSKCAMNLGVYGVDFGYLKMFGIGQDMIEYILVIKDLSNKLGIPENLLIGPVKKIETNLDNPDSVMVLLNKSYTDIENYLRREGRESTAGLMLMGGWIEALYITTQLLFNPENPDKEVVEKIANQKYTLNTLISFMRNFYDDPVVVYYTKKLIYLRRMYDTFDIYYKKGDLEIDTSRKILLTSGSRITISLETLEKIRDYTAKLRTEIVTP